MMIRLVVSSDRLPRQGWLARFLRGMAKSRFRVLGLATIKDIPTERFNELIKQLIAEGWRATSEYSGVDAWIDYGCIRLRKRRTVLKCEWDNWTEGSVEGPRPIIEAIATQNGFAVSHEWRWSEYDSGHKNPSHK